MQSAAGVGVVAAIEIHDLIEHGKCALSCRRAVQVHQRLPSDALVERGEQCTPGLRGGASCGRGARLSRRIERRRHRSSKRSQTKAAPRHVVLMAAHATPCPRGKVKPSAILKVPSETGIFGAPRRAFGLRDMIPR